MTIHFHVGRTPFTFTIHKQEDRERELEEKTTALLWYAMHFPREGAKARYILRKWTK